MQRNFLLQLPGTAPIDTSNGINKRSTGQSVDAYMLDLIWTLAHRCSINFEFKDVACVAGSYSEYQVIYAMFFVMKCLKLLRNCIMKLHFLEVEI